MTDRDYVHGYSGAREEKRSGLGAPASHRATARFCRQYRAQTQGFKQAIRLRRSLRYNLFHVWVARGLKPQVRDRYTTAHFAKLIAAEFYHALLHPT